MVEPITTAGVVAKTLSKAQQAERDEKLRLFRRLFGPSADAIGEAWGRWTEGRVQNVGRIVDKSYARVGDQVNVAGAIPMRVAMPILEQGSYCEDEVMTEYLGGVLASSRTPSGRDDRGARWVALITGLSSYEIRLHYLLYWAAREFWMDGPYQPTWGEESTYGVLSCCVVGSHLVAAMEFSEDEEAQAILAEALFALMREGLIGNFSLQGGGHQLGYGCPPGEEVLSFRVSTVGVQLFMWALGVGNRWPAFSDAALTIDPVEDVPVVKGFSATELRLLWAPGPSA